MKRTPAEPSMLRDIGYDRETETLEIGFNSGTVYQYFDIGQEAFDALMHAPSKGRYFLDEIEPFYEYTEVRQTPRR
jgi:hypothetical protein